MGLDMHLEKRIYIKNWDSTPKGERYSLSLKRGGKKLEGFEPEKVKYIIEEVGYWRKANAIHKWMVENVQGGNDDCGSYQVSRESLQQLLDTVETVLEHSKLVKGEIANGYTYEKTAGGEHRRVAILEKGKLIEDPTVARKLLPTTEGFFFGSTDYDQYYYQDLVMTQEILKKALATSEAYDEFFYSSSW